MKNENWKNKIFNLHFPICTFKYNNIATRNVLEAQALRVTGAPRRRRSAAQALRVTGAPRQWSPSPVQQFISTVAEGLSSTHEGVRAAR